MFRVSKLIGFRIDTCNKDYNILGSILGSPYSYPKPRFYIGVPRIEGSGRERQRDKGGSSRERERQREGG